MSCTSLTFHSSLSEEEFVNILHESGAFKQRSNDTHDAVHGPEIAGAPAGRIKLLLLGDSMLEHLTTTGSHTALGQLTFPTAFNAGVGGDRIPNVIFRLGKKGLHRGLKERGGADVAFLQMGTNDLRPLNDKVIQGYALVIEALQRASPGMQVIVGGISWRADIEPEVVEQSNASLAQLAEQINSESGAIAVHYLPPIPIVQRDLVDHVHMNEGAYERFSEAALEKVAALGFQL